MTAPATIDVTLPRPHAGQIRLDQALKGCRFGVVMCGRRFGKTKYGIYRACRAALDGERVGWFAPTYKYALEAWREISHRLRPVAKSVSEQEKRLELITGGVVECWTMDTPDPARGREYHVVVIDEAGIVRDIEGIWQASIFPTLTRHAGRALFLGTPKGRTHGFTQMFAKGASGESRWASVRAPTKDNPYIPADEIAIAQAELPPGVFAQEYEGIPADDGANPFGMDAIQACILDELSAEAPAVWGWDFARAQDWTVGIALDAYGRVCRFERWQRKPWDETKRMVANATQRVPAVGDSTGIGDVVVESVQQLGVSMTPFMFTPKSKQGLMERLAVAIQSRHIRYPKGVISTELETFSYEYTAHGVRYSAPEGLHDDAVMALALAVYGYDRLSPVVQAQPVFQHEHLRDTNRWEEAVGVSVGVDDTPDPTGFGLGRGW
jgi:hypothetical protein